MLQVVNLKKVYKTKNGADVHALDGVSLQFPETGMVFLLGKSGSGKSTLLNVCGGLDSPTDGEIIIKGRSSKDFSQSDFDSYRNTFVGFIFQEYNILNEFSVEDNIALALELQGKPKDRASIDALLQQVDLQGYAKRKPNTLSGGQKQRIAIARALIKAPEIIMADEPTGALDSNTGKQVFETLKKLSADKLVIVVSHDREFAEQYGDRIIELMDGKVISDVSKTSEPQKSLTDRINAVGDVLCIKGGSELTDADFAKIKEYLKTSDKDVIIAGGQKDVETFKKVSRIHDDGSKEVFRDTEGDKPVKQYSKEESRFIRSKLPIKHAFKIGVSGLKSKPVRLFFTVILCTVAFVLFGLLSTLNFYDSRSTFNQTMADASIPVMQIGKEYKTVNTWYANGKEESSHEGVMSTRLTDKEVGELGAALNANAFGAYAAPSGDLNLKKNNSYYWLRTIYSYAYLPEDNPLRGQINGTYPKNDNEMVLSSYLAKVLLNCEGYNSEGALLSLKSPEEIIGKKIAVGGQIYLVTGIFDSGEIPEQYSVLQEEGEPLSSTVQKYNTYLRDSLHQVVFVSANRVKTISRNEYWYSEGIENYTSAVIGVKIGGQYKMPEYGNTSYIGISDAASDVTVVPVTAGKTTPGNGEAILSSNSYSSLIMDLYYAMADEVIDNDTLRERYYAIANLAGEISSGGVYKENADGKHELHPFTDEQMIGKIKELIGKVKNNPHALKIAIAPFDNNNQIAIGDPKELTVVGVSLSDRPGTTLTTLSDADFTALWEVQKELIDYYSLSESKYEEPVSAVYTTVFLPYEYSEETLNSYWGYYSDEGWQEDDSRFSLTGGFVDNLKNVDAMVKSLSQVFLYVGLVLAVFAALLFSNFISVSISQKQRDIGILRAVGARSTDVFKIFFSESFVIALICVLLSTVASALLCGLINTALAEGLGASLFVFGIPSFAILIAIAGLTAVVATFLPVYNAAKKKPVDSIRAL